MYNVWSEATGTSKVTDRTIEQELADPAGAEATANQKTLQLGAALQPDVVKLSLGGAGNSDTTINSVTNITPSTQALRYPASPNITDNTDYVLFEFYRYKPPYRARKASLQNPEGGDDLKSYVNNIVNSGSVIDYNDADMYADAQRAAGYNNIIMYMPEDISTGFRAQWGGKNLTNFAAGALRAAGADGFNKINDGAKMLMDGARNIPYMLGAKVIREFVQATSGDSLSNDDVFGAISGAILNPNTELLFSGVDMRNFQLNFKLVPRDAEEAAMCNAIVGHFKKASLPDRVPEKIFGNAEGGVKKNFIGAPKLVRVSFMSGANEHQQLPKFKMCALTQVDVNYTPDGVYATYVGGQPVAMNLTLNFQETKICFADEVNANGIGGLR